MKCFELSFPMIMMRLYLMMAVVIIAGFSGFWWLALLALPIFLSALLAVRIDWRLKQKEEVSMTTRRALPDAESLDSKHAA